MRKMMHPQDAHQDHYHQPLTEYEREAHDEHKLMVSEREKAIQGHLTLFPFVFALYLSTW